MTITDKDREAAAAIVNEWWTGKPTPTLEQRIAAAIAQAREEGRREEREACAKVCDLAAGEWLSAEESAHKASVPAAKWTYGTKADAAKKCAAAIRARGED